MERHSRGSRLERWLNIGSDMENIRRRKTVTERMGQGNRGDVIYGILNQDMVEEDGAEVVARWWPAPSKLKAKGPRN